MAGRKILVTLDDALVRRLDDAAREQGVSRSALIATLADRELGGAPPAAAPDRRRRPGDPRAGREVRHRRGGRCRRGAENARRAHRAPLGPLTTFVVDASVVLQWFRDEPGSDEARALAREELLAPPLLYLEVVNVAGRKWRWDEGALIELVDLLDRSGVILDEATLSGVVRWTARGLTAYDAAYVALAEERECRLVTADAGIVELVPGIAVPLGR